VKTYLVFAGCLFYPGGGWRDFRGVEWSLDKAKELAERAASGYDHAWWQIIDADTLQVVADDSAKEPDYPLVDLQNRIETEKPEDWDCETPVYEIGDKVEVICGRHTGKIGTILKKSANFTTMRCHYSVQVPDSQDFITFDTTSWFIRKVIG
jgi:hypothetical protein